MPNREKMTLKGQSECLRPIRKGHLKASRVERVRFLDEVVRRRQSSSGAVWLWVGKMSTRESLTGGMSARLSMGLRSWLLD